MAYLLKDNCTKCSKPLQVYYGTWCPRCDKPEIKTVPTLNLLRVLYHIEAIGHPGFKDRVWGNLCDTGSIKGNDSVFELYFEDQAFYESFETDPEFEESDKQQYRDEKLIMETFGLSDYIIFDVSW